MHDIKWIRENPDAFDAAMKKRGLVPYAQEILALDEAQRSWQTQLQELQSKKNQIAKAVGAAKAKKEDATALFEEGKKIAGEIDTVGKAISSIENLLPSSLSSLPNIPANDVPVGADEKANKELRAWGEKTKFDFKPKEHFEIGEGLKLMDFERAAKISGARFVVLSGALARLERALAQFMLDHNTQQFGYTEMYPPLLVKDDAAFGTGQLPKFGEDLFRTTNDFWLVPTAEVPLTNLVREEILEESALPLRWTAYTPCFRSEAGAAGKDTRGMIRQHQFSKVEMVSITTPEQSEAEHERMTSCAESILQKLGLPYRVMVLSTGDMGFCAKKTYDIEVWLPGQNMYREISSCSNCGDFQARRMKARYKTADKKNAFVHTLNGSGLPTGRTLIAILENYQRADGKVTVPEALRPYMGGLDVIG